MNMLQLEHVSKHFGGIKAVDDVSLGVEEGSIVGLIGPNGSGKTTLFNLIGGTEKKDSGEITFNGVSIGHLPQHKLFDLGLGRTFQTPRLFFAMTVLENTLLAGKEQKGESPLVAPFLQRWEKEEEALGEKAQKQLKALEIETLYDKPSSEISGGQMKLLQLSTALVGDPKMMLLDEPTAGVAPRLAQDIFDAIQKQRKEKGTTFFIIEHRLEVLFQHVDRVFVMHQGKIITEGKPETVVKDQRVIDAYLGS